VIVANDSFNSQNPIPGFRFNYVADLKLGALSRRRLAICG